MGKRRRVLCAWILMGFALCQRAYGEAKAYIVMEMNTGRALFEKNADELLPIASTTKIMTALLALENCALTESVTASSNASGVPGTSIYLSAGETLSMEDMLYGLMLRSGNDAAVAIAEHTAGSVEAFSQLMNAKAEKIGAQAYFTTPNGLDEGGNGASARGITLIAREALKIEEFRRIVGTKKKTIPWSDHKYERALTNKNKLLSDCDGAFGVKTGYTKKAGRCLVFACSREGMEIVGCVLNCPDWFNESQRLIDKGYEEYDMRLFYEEGEIIDDLLVGGRTVEIACAQDVKAPVKKGESLEVRIDTEKLTLPVYEGQTAGKIRLISDQEEIASFDLVCMQTRTAPSFDSAFRLAVSLWPMQG